MASVAMKIYYDFYCLSPKEGGHVLGRGTGNSLRLWMPGTSQVITIPPLLASGLPVIGEKKSCI